MKNINLIPTSILSYLEIFLAYLKLSLSVCVCVFALKYIVGSDWNDHSNEYPQLMFCDKQYQKYH